MYNRAEIKLLHDLVIDKDHEIMHHNEQLPMFKTVLFNPNQMVKLSLKDCIQ